MTTRLQITFEIKFRDCHVYLHKKRYPAKDFSCYNLMIKISIYSREEACQILVLKSRIKIYGMCDVRLHNNLFFNLRWVGLLNLQVQ
jgi:hypothetical protein